MAQNKLRGMMQVEGMLDEIGMYIEWVCQTLPSFEQLYFTWQTVQYCHINLLQRKSMLQMQFIGERMEAQCLSNFTDGFQVRKTIWNFVNSLDVMLTVE